MEYDEGIQDSMFAYSETKQKIIHISEIDEEQRKLPYTCPKCKQKMIAALGEKNIHHFRHYAKTKCTGSLESSLHQFGKEVLEKNKMIKLPEQSIRVAGAHGVESKIIVAPEQMLIFDNIVTEAHIEDIIPDIIVYKEGKPLLVEIYVTHAIDLSKKSKIKNQKLPTIEIDVGSTFDNFTEFNRQVVEEFIINNTSRKTWIYSEKIEERENEIKEQTRKEQEIQQKKQIQEEMNQQEIHQRKVDRIKELIKSSNFEKIKSQWNYTLKNDPLWQKYSKWLGITVNSIPPYLNKEIRGEQVFGCDRRIWQSALFYI